MSLDRIRDEHRLWLAGHGLLDRPWFVLGSAPNPTIPPGIADRAALICINNVGVTTAKLGLPPADLTFRNLNKEWRTIAECKLPLVLWISDRTPLQIFLKRLRIKAQLGEIRRMRPGHRDQIYRHMLQAGGSEPNEIGKPSTGVFAVLYALFVGVPEIVLGGLSMDKQGYSHAFESARMMHGQEDLSALATIARHYSSVSTTEPAVARAGLPVYSGLSNVKFTILPTEAKLSAAVRPKSPVRRNE